MKELHRQLSRYEEMWRGGHADLRKLKGQWGLVVAQYRCGSAPKQSWGLPAWSLFVHRVPKARHSLELEIDCRKGRRYQLKRHLDRMGIPWVLSSGGKVVVRHPLWVMELLYQADYLKPEICDWTNTFLHTRSDDFRKDALTRAIRAYRADMDKARHGTWVVKGGPRYESRPQWWVNEPHVDITSPLTDEVRTVMEEEE